MSYRTFESPWGTAQIPDSWTATADAICVSLSHGSAGGAAQISAYRKETAVTDEDLTGFASDGPLKSRALQRVVTASLTGFCAEGKSDGMQFRAWWLRSGRLLVYVTHIAEEPEEHERSIVNQIVESLTPTPSSTD